MPPDHSHHQWKTNSPSLRDSHPNLSGELPNHHEGSAVAAEFFIPLLKTQMLSIGDKAYLATWEESMLVPVPDPQIIFFVRFDLNPMTISCKIHKQICSCCIILGSLFMGGLCLSSHQ